MEIGILVYSYTGNTYNVAEKIKEQIVKNGDKVKIIRVTSQNGKLNGRKPIILNNMPDLSEFDKLIIGGPINGFNLCAVLKTLFKTIKINASQVNCFVTQHFKSSHFGGNRGIKQISGFVTKSGTKVNNTSIIHWSAKNREEQIETTATLMAEFGAII